MLNFGIEWEFFVVNQSTLEIVPAFECGCTLDGNPFIGELRTGVHNNILDCVFELKKLMFKEKKRLHSLVNIKAPLGHMISPDCEFNANKELLLDLRANADFVEEKETEPLREYSVYPDGKVGKILKKGQFKTSLQINMSDNRSFDYPIWKKIEIDDKTKYEKSSDSKNYSSLFNYMEPIIKLDKAFSNDIKSTNRVPGVYAIKEGQKGMRVEYRSLPSTVDLDAIVNVLYKG